MVCTLQVPDGAVSDSDSLVVRLAVNDVSLADAPATADGGLAVPVPVGVGLGGPYEVDAELDPGRSYALAVHIDRSGDGVLAAGDLINAVRVPVAVVPEVIVGVPLNRV